MNLWLDNLSNSLSGYDSPPYYGPAEMKRPFFIFDHFAMEVPRLWWKPYLHRGKPGKNHVGILHDLFNDLKECPELEGRINYGLLVPIAFLDGEVEPSFGNLPNQHSKEEYHAWAEKCWQNDPM
jgi:hypothetical protein